MCLTSAHLSNSSAHNTLLIDNTLSSSRFVNHIACSRTPTDDGETGTNDTRDVHWTTPSSASLIAGTAAAGVGWHHLDVVWTVLGRRVLLAWLQGRWRRTVRHCHCHALYLGTRLPCQWRLTRVALLSACSIPTKPPSTTKPTSCYHSPGQISQVSKYE